jgi:maltokinase
VITLERLLAAWLPEQRWFGDKGRRIGTVATTTVAALRAADPRLEVRLADVDFADELGGQTYVVPLSYHGHPQDHLRHALIGELPEDGRLLWVYDGLADRDTTPLWTDLLASGARVGALAFHPEPGADIPREVPGDVSVAEQSNTSLIYGEDAIMKVFRRLEPGLNPDVEVHSALRPLNNPHIAPLLGYVELVTGDDGGTPAATLAMLQTFLPVASDGWSLATASVRDLYTERDLHADEVGGDFAGESYRLGAATAAVHADLARALPTEPPGPDWLAETADMLGHRLAEATAVVPALASRAPQLQASYDAVRKLTLDQPLQRIHGDLHLGQALRTAQRWVLLDFEGEPARPMATRRHPDSLLRDVAGMLRSFDYAARHLLIDEPEDSQLEYRAAEWADRNRDAFCDGYTEAAGTDPRAYAALLRAFEADKAVYEAVYEARNRPRWLPIPLGSLARLTTEGAA